MKRLTSRKFWMACVSALLVLLNDGLGLNIPSDTVLGFTAIVVSYLAAQGWVDGKQAAPNKGGAA